MPPVASGSSPCSGVLGAAPLVVRNPAWQRGWRARCSPASRLRGAVSAVGHRVHPVRHEHSVCGTRPEGASEYSRLGIGRAVSLAGAHARTHKRASLPCGAPTTAVAARAGHLGRRCRDSVHHRWLRRHGVVRQPRQRRAYRTGPRTLLCGVSAGAGWPGTCQAGVVKKEERLHAAAHARADPHPAGAYTRLLSRSRVYISYLCVGAAATGGSLLLYCLGQRRIA